MNKINLFNLRQFVPHHMGQKNCVFALLLLCLFHSLEGRRNKFGDTFSPLLEVDIELLFMRREKIIAPGQGKPLS